MGLLDFLLDDRTNAHQGGGVNPAAAMDGSVFYGAAQRAGLATDHATLNRIVQGVNQGMSPDEAARAAKGGSSPMGLLGAAPSRAPRGGLLGGSWDDPRTAASISASLSLLTPTTRKRGFMEGLAEAMGAYQSTLSTGRRQQEGDQFRQWQQQMALQQAQRQAAQQQAQDEFRLSIESPQMQASKAALAGGGGPTVANAARMQPVDPNAQFMHGAMRAGLMTPMEYMAGIRKDRTPMITKAGDVARDPVTGQELWRNEDKAHTPADWRLFQLSGAPQRGMTFDQWDAERRKASRPTVSVDLRGDNEYSKAQGKEYSELMSTINRAGFNAPAQIRKLERLSQLLDGVDGGKLAPLGLDIASAAGSFGIKLDPRLGNKEAAQALAREIAGGFRQPGTGPMTDKDFENFLTQVPDLSKTSNGRKQITATMKAALNRDMKLAQLAREYERRHGRIDGGYLDSAAAFIAENPVVAAPAGWTVER